MPFDLNQDACVYRELIKVNGPTLMDNTSLLQPSVENAIYVASMWIPVYCNPILIAKATRYFPIVLPAAAFELALVPTKSSESGGYYIYNSEDELVSQGAVYNFAYFKANVGIIYVNETTNLNRNYYLKVTGDGGDIPPFTLYYRSTEEL